MGDISARSKLDVCVLGALLIGIGAVYLNWMPTTFAVAEDAAANLRHIESGAVNFHPNHLLFEPIMQALLGLCRLPFPGVEAVDALRGIVLGFALAMFAGVFTIIRRRHGVSVAALGTAFTAATFGVWHYALAVDAYVPALALAVWALAIFDLRPTERPGRHAIVLALATSAAVLMHQLYIFLAIVLWFGLWLSSRPNGSARPALIYGLVGAAVLTVAYGAAYVAETGNALNTLDVLRWSRGHASGGLWAPPGPRTPLFGLAGLGAAIVSVVPFVGLPGAGEIARTLAPGKLIVEEIYAAEAALGPSGAIALSAIGLAALGLCAVLVWRALGHSNARPWDKLELSLVWLVAAYALLACVWEAINLEFWIHVVVFLVLIVCLRTPWGSRRAMAPALAATVALSAVNLLGGARAYNDPANDFWQVQTAPLRSAAREADTILLACPWMCRQYLSEIDEPRLALPGKAVLLISASEHVLLSSFALAPPFAERPGAKRQRDAFVEALRDGPLGLPDINAHDLSAEHVLWKLVEPCWNVYSVTPLHPREPIADAPVNGTPDDTCEGTPLAAGALSK
ncbi:MAG: hypothetical protein AAFU80_08665 [Pseudomonadota bacterium]